MYLTTNRRRIVFDIECDSLTPTVVWVVCAEDVDSGETWTFNDYDQIREFFKQDAIWIGHNVLKYDAPALNHIVGTRLRLSSMVDTLVLSNLYNPSLPDGHSLGAWAERLGGPQKVEHEDWSHLSSAMVKRCRTDVSINVTLYKRLVGVLRKLNFSEKTCEIQHYVTDIVRRQQRNGFYFNNVGAIELYQTIRAREQALTGEIRQAFPATLASIGRYSKAFKQDGEPSGSYLRHSGKYPVVQLNNTGGYECFDWREFSIGSPKQRIEKLLALGWEPEEFTPPSKTHPKGQPKPTDKGQLTPSLERFLETVDVPEAKLIPKWMMFNSIAGMVNTWLDNFNEETHCIHGDLFVAGTLRFRHSNPNTANIPAVRINKETHSPVLGGEGFYTYESRDLWTARPNRILVGTDAAGLELRMLAHYLNRPEFTQQVINGDPHQYNADVVGIPRPQAKNLLYAIQYGAQAKKVAKMSGNVSLAKGKQIRNEFLERLGLNEVMEEAQDEQRRGRVSLVDGAQVVCPSPHAALNYKLQGGGARVMAQGAIFLEGHIKRLGLDSLKVGDIHDEWQYDVEPRDAIKHGEMAVRSLQEAGEELGLRVPIDGTSKEGLTWSKTH